MNRATKSRTRHIAIAGTLGIAALLLVPIAAQAFGRGGRHQPDPDRAAARLSEKLDLTAEQREQVQAVLEEDFARRADARETHRREMETLRDQNRDNLAAVLTPEQLEKLDQLQATWQGRAGRRDGIDRRSRGCDDGPAFRD